MKIEKDDQRNLGALVSFHELRDILFTFDKYKILFSLELNLVPSLFYAHDQPLITELGLISKEFRVVIESSYSRDARRLTR